VSAGTGAQPSADFTGDAPVEAPAEAAAPPEPQAGSSEPSPGG